jgi:hypothetical protein
MGTTIRGVLPADILPERRSRGVPRAFGAVRPKVLKVEELRCTPLKVERLADFDAIGSVAFLAGEGSIYMTATASSPTAAEPSALSGSATEGTNDGDHRHDQ